MRVAKRLFSDGRLCSGCLACVTTCSQYNEGMNTPSRSRIYIEVNTSIGAYRPHYCVQCKDAPCAKICPVGAIWQELEEGYWYVDYEACIGCKECISACPLGAMFFDPIGEKVIKCETCQGEPACAKVCPTTALFWGSGAEWANFRKAKAKWQE